METPCLKMKTLNIYLTISKGLKGFSQDGWNKQNNKTACSDIYISHTQSIIY